MNPITVSAVRTVSEDDRWRVIEGRAIPFGGPFNGKDTYGTFFSARTDLALDDELPKPVWYHHGLDPEFKFSAIGRTVPEATRSEADGIWVQAQIDKRHRYYEERVKPLLDAGEVGFSAGSAEHSYRQDAKTGELLDYPVHEISLTPTESNPWAFIAARTDDIAATMVSVVAERRDIPTDQRKEADAADFAGPDRSFPILKPEDVSAAASSLGRAKGDRDAIKAKIISIAKRKGAAFTAELPKAWTSDAGRSAAMRGAATEAAMGAGALGSLLYIMECEADEPDQLAMLQTSADALTEWITAERGEVGTPEDNDDMPMAAMTGIRAGRRNSASDAAHIMAAHDHLVAIGAHDETTAPATDADADTSARSADSAPQPAVIAVRANEPTFESLRSELLAKAAEAGTTVARSLIPRG